jgi:hypothetical protein
MTRGWLSVVAILTALSSVAGGCGGDDESPRSLLKDAAAKQIKSGEISLRAATDIPGFPILGDKLVVTADGPFAMQGSGLPALDWRVVLRAGSDTFPADLTAVDGKAYVDFQGLSYEADPEMFGGLPKAGRDGAPSLGIVGLDPGMWLKGEKVEDGEEIGGDKTKLVTGAVDERAVLQDLAALLERPEVRERAGQARGPWKLPELDEQTLERVADNVHDAKVEVNVDDEGYARRLFASLRFTVPDNVKDAAFDGGNVSVELVVEKIGARVDVIPPANPRPLSDLLNFAGLIFGVEKPSDLWTVPR